MFQLEASEMFQLEARRVAPHGHMPSSFAKERPRTVFCHRYPAMGARGLREEPWVNLADVGLGTTASPRSSKSSYNNTMGREKPFTRENEVAWGPRGVQHVLREVPTGSTGQRGTKS
eukprot:771687-Prorocentrum_minimum.AAC.1